MVGLGYPPQRRGSPGVDALPPLSPQLLHVISFLTLPDLLKTGPDLPLPP